MIPGEILTAEGEIEINAGREHVTLRVLNTGDRPVQVGSHFHFAEANTALDFDRAASHGRRLDIPAGTAVRLEPGEAREVRLSISAASGVSSDSGVWSTVHSTALSKGRPESCRQR